MAVLRWIVGGLIGGAVGVAIWVLIGYFAQIEVGWIAWGIGFVVGVGVRYAAHLGDHEESFVQGVLAAAIAVGSIVTAKYLVFVLLTGGIDRAALRELRDELHVDQDTLIARIADDVVKEEMASGKTISWPAGMSLEQATRKADYPPVIWAQADFRFKSLPFDEQMKRKEKLLELAVALSDLGREPKFSEFFSPWDFLWVGLAMLTAFRIGVGSYGAD